MAQAKTVNTVAEWSPYHTMIIAILLHCADICTYTVRFMPPPVSLFCFKLLGVDRSSGVNIKLDPPVTIILRGNLCGTAYYIKPYTYIYTYTHYVVGAGI